MIDYERGCKVLCIRKLESSQYKHLKIGSEYTISTRMVNYSYFLEELPYTYGAYEKTCFMSKSELYEEKMDNRRKAIMLLEKKTRPRWFTKIIKWVGI